MCTGEMCNEITISYFCITYMQHKYYEKLYKQNKKLLFT